jgi:hypothetical protein
MSERGSFRLACFIAHWDAFSEPKRLLALNGLVPWPITQNVTKHIAEMKKIDTACKQGKIKLAAKDPMTKIKEWEHRGLVSDPPIIWPRRSQKCFLF